MGGSNLFFHIEPIKAVSTSDWAHVQTSIMGPPFLTRFFLLCNKSDQIYVVNKNLLTFEARTL